MVHQNVLLVIRMFHYYSILRFFFYIFLFKCKKIRKEEVKVQIKVAKTDINRK